MVEYFKNYNKTKCYGCRSCEQICPVNAISMIVDDEGFLYPRVNNEKCIGCGKCQKVCPESNEYCFSDKSIKQRAYAIINKDKNALKRSSSGGAFSIIADYIIRKKGIVIGCKYDEEWNPVHAIVEQMSELNKLQGSKYVQSDTQNTYTKTRDELENGRYVLYTGTPCQIAGLKLFLKKDYPKLLTIDLVCHGVASNQLFHQYIEYIEKKYKAKLINFTFRDKKKHGWSTAGTIKLKKDEKEIVKSIYPTNDYYYYYYLHGGVYRESCYSCKYATVNREGDFTIADYWNVQKYHPNIDVSGGVSLLLINTDKAQKAFSEFCTKLMCVETKVSWASCENGNLIKPTTRPKSRDLVYSRIKANGFEKTAKQDCKLQYIIPALKRAIPYNIKLKIKKIINRWT